MSAVAGLMAGLTPADATSRFVAGTLPSYAFEQMLRNDDGLQLYLTGDGTAYPEGSLLLHLLGLDWMLPEHVVEAQRALVAFLRGRGLRVAPTDRYEGWVGLIKKQYALRARVQPSWLDIPAAYFALLLEECSSLDGASLETALRMKVTERFRCQGRPPRWLHDQPWPVNQHGPMLFVDQVDISSGPNDTSYCYVFFDERDVDYLVLVQSSTWPGVTDARVAAGVVADDVAAPRGVSIGGGPVLEGAVGTAHWETAAPLAVRFDRGRKPRPPSPLPPGKVVVGPVVVGAGRAARADEGHPLVPGGAPQQDVPAPSAVSVHRQMALPLADVFPRAAKPTLTRPRPAPVLPPVRPVASVGLVVPSVPAATVVAGQVAPVRPEAAPDPPTIAQPIVQAPPGSVQALPPTVPLGDRGLPDDDLDHTRVVDRPAARYALVLQDGRTFPLRARTVVLGRRPTVTEPGGQAVTLTDVERAVSKTHARLELVDGAWHITDLGSTNGVAVSTPDGDVVDLWPGDRAPVHGWFALGPVEVRLVNSAGNSAAHRLADGPVGVAVAR